MEDVYFGKHKSVWGSFYDLTKKRWGYKCCYTFDKTVDTCKGEAGRNAYTAQKKADEERKAQEEAARTAAEAISSSDESSSDSDSDTERKRKRSRKRHDKDLE